MNIEDQTNGCSGRFQLSVFERGELVEQVDEQNMVVTNSRIVLASLLAGLAGGLTRLGVGTNATPPVTANTSLTNYQNVPLGVIDLPTPGDVRFAFSAEPDDFVGLQISEFGLLTSDNVLFARKTRLTPLNKTTDISFSGLWTISFKV